MVSFSEVRHPLARQLAGKPHLRAMISRRDVLEAVPESLTWEAR